MPRQVEIHVTGLSFCFVRDGMWHLILVSDEVHPLLLQDPDGRRTPLRRGTTDLTCNFAGARTPGPPAIFPHNRMPNLSEEFAHDGNLVLLRRNRWNTCTLSMQLPDSRIDASGPNTSDDCWLQEVRAGGGGRRKNYQRVTTKIIFRFSIQSNALNALRVAVTEQVTGDVYDQRFPKAASADPLIFEFDNGCCNHCTRNDSIDLYDVVNDRRGNGLQFVSGFSFGGNVPGHDPTHPWPRVRGQKILNPTYGNCDPVGSDPPPDGPWPPALIGATAKKTSTAKGRSASTAAAKLKPSAKGKATSVAKAKPLSGGKAKAKVSSISKVKPRSTAKGKATSSAKAKPKSTSSPKKKPARKAKR